jgi:ATP-dependent Clp protease ATP-binding subunit ClpA
VLGLYALDETMARRVLESLGISRQVFTDQLEYDAGPSPNGSIALTPRARMILGLAGGEAARTGSGEIQPEHVLLAAIRESENHLLAAAQAVGVTLAEIERNLMREMR